MKIIHISDPHLGKSLHGYSLREDQKHWCKEFLKVVDEEKPQAVLIAGDIYDRSTPAEEAVDLADWFFTELSKRDTTVMAISGNHDSGHKLAFLNGIMEKSGVYISGRIEKEIKHVTLKDEYGDVTFWLVPYFFPAAFDGVEGFEERPKSYDEAMKKYIELQNIDFSKRNVIIAHQLVTANGYKDDILGGSETIVGGVGNIMADNFFDFDYTALGHIHRAQRVVKDNIRYAGSPLCYHFDELKFPNKGPVVVTLKEKNTDLDIKVVPIKPLHELMIIEGEFADIMTARETGIYKKTDENGKVKEYDLHDKYIQIILNDERVESGAYDTLKLMVEAHGGKLMACTHNKKRSVKFDENTSTSVAETKSVADVFGSFWEFTKGGQSLSEDEEKVINFLSDLVESEEKEKVISGAFDDADALIEMLMKEENS